MPMYKRFEQWLLSVITSKKQRFSVLFFTLLLLVATVFMIPYESVLAKMLPGKNNNTFSLYVKLPIGSSIEQTNAVSLCAIEHLKNEKEITDIELFLGKGAPLDFAGLIKGSAFKNSENVAEIVANLTNKHHREEPSFDIVQRIRPEVQQCELLVNNSHISFVEPPAGPPVQADIIAELYSEDNNLTTYLSHKIADIFKHTQGLVDIDIQMEMPYPVIAIDVQSDKIIKSGLDIKQVNNILYLAFEGKVIATKNSSKYQQQVPIYLSLDKKTKNFNAHDIVSIRNTLSALKLLNKNGQLVPLTEVVNLKITQSNPMIVHKDLKRMVAVMAATDQVSQVYPLLDARSMIKKKLSQEFEIKHSGLFDLTLIRKVDGHQVKLLWDGEMKVTIDTFIDLGGAFIAALILIFLLMVIYYKSFKLSGIVLFGSFLSIIGVILGHWIMDVFTPKTFFLTATSLIGFIALIGISSRNSLLLIDFTKSLMIEKGLHKYDAIAYASATRAKPIFLTATAIILASTLLAGDAVFGGLGVSLIFGTMAAVVASLIVVPVLLANLDLESCTNYHELNETSLEEPLPL